MVIKGVEVLGTKAIKQQLGAAADTLKRQSLLKGLRPGATTIRKELARCTPVRTGTLLRSLMSRAHKGDNEESWASIGITYRRTNYLYKGKMVKPFYAIMVHNGTIIGKDGKRARTDKARRKGKERIKANPWVYDVFSRTYDKALDKSLTKFVKMLTQ